MSSIPDFLSAGSTLAIVALIAAGVLKLFQLATDVHEMKDALQDIRRSTRGSAGLAAAPPVSVAHAPTPEELVRSVHAQSFSDDFPV